MLSKALGRSHGRGTIAQSDCGAPGLAILEGSRAPRHVRWGRLFSAEGIAEENIPSRLYAVGISKERSGIFVESALEHGR